MGTLREYYEAHHGLFSVLNLTPAQSSVLLAWISKLSIPAPEETATAEQQPFNVTYYQTGIGEVFYVWTIIDNKKYSVHLGYDDDGNIIGEV